MPGWFSGPPKFENGSPVGASSGWRPPELNAIHCAPGHLQRESPYFRSYYQILKGILIPPRAPSASFWRQCGRAGGSEVVSLEGGHQLAVRL